MPRRDDIHKILLLGSGPIVIGQASEFDYSGTQACKALREEGYEVVLVNSNPASIMTDPETADRTYIEPLTPEIVEKVIEKERPDALLPTMEDANYEVLAQALEEMKVYYEGQPKELSIHLLWFDTLLWRTDTVSSEDQWRTKKKMDELDDFLEQSPYVQKKKEEGRKEGREIGREEGREIGREEGLEEGLARGLQKAFVAIVEGRFPPLVELAQERVSQVTQPDELGLLLKQIATIPDETSALWLLNSIAA